MNMPAELSEKYSGTIFACAEISGPAEYFEEEPARYFSSRSFAPLGKVHTFANPLPDHEFADYLKVGQNTPSTPLYEREFEGLKRQLSERNPLPELSEACPHRGRELPRRHTAELALYLLLS